MIDWKAWLIHTLGGVTAQEQEAGLRLARPLKRMLADMNESLYRLGHYHHADTEAAKSVWLGMESEEPPSELAKMAESNAAFPARQAAHAAHIRTRASLPAVRRFPASAWADEQTRLDKRHDERH